jgi:hypothetical protein
VVRAIGNTHISVNKLPPEILFRVLEHRDYESDLVAATHVCQYWRSTLTSSPSLWGCIDILSRRDSDRALTYFERSKSTPIDVHLDAWSSQNLKVLDYLAPHITRTRSLTTYGSHKDILATSILFRDPTPSLQRLEMHCRGDTARLSGAFFGQQVPSLRSLTLHDVCPALESPFSFPNLTELSLHLPARVGPFPITSLFRLCSSCPRLQKMSIDISSKTFTDVALHQVISLESLAELNFTCNTADAVLPCMNLPRLERLRVNSSLQAGQVHKFADILPYGGRVLLARGTKVLYHLSDYSRAVELSGGGVNASLALHFTRIDLAPVDWFSDEPSTPFEQIEELTVKGRSTLADFAIDVFRNLRVLRVLALNAQFNEELFRLLGSGIPCPTLQEIQCICLGPLDPLIELATTRLRAGYRLGLVRLATRSKSHLDKVAELRELVGEVMIQEEI